MKDLQQFDFDKSHYERPAQKWVCGRLDQGCPCHTGPDKKGHCRANYKKLYECNPWKDGDRWKCSRPNSLGGACQDGPSPLGVCCREIPPCQPQLSHRAKRGRVALYTLSFAAAILFIFMFGIYTKSFASPGNLTTPHSAILAKVQAGIAKDSDDCGICHTAGEGDATKWVQRAFKFKDHDTTESVKCLSCHRQSRDTPGNEKESLALNIHGISGERLTKHTEKVSKKKDDVYLETLSASSYITSLSGRATKDSKGNYHQVACATCHREHRGRNYDLKALTNQQCQTCHTLKFSSFSSGHPIFDHFPYDRRTRIKFDHITHFETYFTDQAVIDDLKSKNKAIPQKCNNCHKLDEGNQLMVVKTFEETCIVCHQKDILKPDEDINVIRFPGFNMEEFLNASKENKYKPVFEQWPSMDEEDSGEVTNFMRLLLSQDEELSDDEIADKLDFWINDLFLDAPEDGDKTELKAMNTYIQIIERLVQEIAEEDDEKLKARFEKVLGASIENKIAATYFPNLSDLLQVAQKTLPSTPWSKEKISPVELANKDTPTGWYYQNYTIKYRPAGHKDAVMKNWLDLTAKHYKEKTNTGYLFEALNRCVKCHSINKSSVDGVENEIEWKPNKPSNRGRFNKFSHSPHLALLDEVGCVQCHTLKKQGDEIEKGEFKKQNYEDIYKQKDYHQFMSNFTFMNKDLCSKCHTQNAAGDQCTLCHNYHVGPFEPALNTTIEQIKEKVSMNNLKHLKGLLPQKEFAVK